MSFLLTLKRMIRSNQFSILDHLHLLCCDTNSSSSTVYVSVSLIAASMNKEPHAFKLGNNNE